MLADLDFELAKRAVTRLIATSKFLPTIAEVRSAATAFELGPVRAGGEAWGDVVAAIRFVGHYGIPKFEDPLVAHCVECLSWRGLCLGENEAADRARFIEMYDAVAERRRTDDVARAEPLRLPDRDLRHLPASKPKGPALLGSVVRLPTLDERKEAGRER